MEKKKIIKIIGSGFSSLSAACFLAKDGFDVEIFEKNSHIGGRAQQLKKDGFVFDMGPTFYWMPDVIEEFFNKFDKKVSDYYDLKRLDPGYRIYFSENEFIDSSVDNEKLFAQFEKIEKGSSIFLKKFLKDSKTHYDIGVKDIIYKPALNPFELVKVETAVNVHKFLRSISREIRKNIKNEKLCQFLEFPVIFLGAKPSDIPAFYSFMNYADIELGTWHPMGGMYKLVEAMGDLAKSLGVKINTDSAVSKINISDSKVQSIVVKGDIIKTDVLLSGADYHHTELLMDKVFRNYSEAYWSKKTFAPSAVLFFIAFDKKIENVEQHSLFFDSDFNKHIDDIYSNPKWTDSPLFYASFPSISDSSLAPEGKESAIILIPIAPGISENKDKTEEYFENVITRLEEITNNSLRNHILFKETYSISDFVKDYNSYKGNAYGLANILLQTAFLRPKLKSKKLNNMFFTGQLTVPGPGVPPTIVSGEVVSKLIKKEFKNESF
jgi:phytoene desaturase